MGTRRAVLTAAEASLALLTVVVAISLERLFTDTSFFGELLVLVLGSHLVAAICRRAELSMLWATPVSAVTLVALGTAVFYPDVSTLLVVPSSETVSVLGEDLREAWQVFGDESAPVPPVRGFVVTTAVLLWYGAFLADWAAFRLRSPLEAITPATATFVFASLLGVDRNQVSHGLLFALGLLAVLLTLRADRQVREEVWVAGGAGRGVRTTLGLGAGAGIAAVLVGALIAPRLPGATAQPIIDVTEITNSSQSRSVLSPLVEVSTSLIDQPDRELFSVDVEPEDRDYWRLMALTRFEDEIWRRSSNFDEVRGDVGTSTDPGVRTRPVTQEVTITGLGNIYLPAAYEVSTVVDDGGVDLEYEVATGALVVERGLEHIPSGLTYEIESRVPDHRVADLPADATAGLDGGFVAEHTALPATCGEGDSSDSGCWPSAISDEALRIVTDAGAVTDHDRVLALQNYFLDPTRFTYNLDVALNHDIDDMTEFLEVREGYCEQFASTFAAMARSLGIPARVAVGFTWGDWDETRGEYVVSGKHAHAWPEVHFAGAGWLVFDPTPGRSRGLDGDITGLSTPEQVGEELATPPPEVTPSSVPSDLDTPPGPDDPETSAPPASTPPADPGGPGQPVPVDDTGGGNGPWVALAVAGMFLALIGVVPGVQLLRRRRRIARIAADPVGQGELAWDDALGALGLLGFTPVSGQTPNEFATLVERSKREFGPVQRLADEVTRLRYAAPDDAVTHAVAAQDAATEIVRRCRNQAGTGPVLWYTLDPRGLAKPAPPMPSLRR